MKTRLHLLQEQRASALILWLHSLAKSCDALCLQVCSGFSESRHVVPLFSCDLKLPKQLATRLHSLFLTLLAVPSFKWKLAHAYCDTYEAVTDDYARGVGGAECSPYGLSVQFLNRQNFVTTLVVERGLLEILTNSLWNALLTSTKRATSKKKAKAESTLQLDLASSFLSHRRYFPVVNDLKCVLNVPTIPRLFASKCLPTWIKSLELLQNMDPQVWRPRTSVHVSHEPRGWVNAFNIAISLSSLFEKVACWYGESGGDGGGSYATLVTVTAQVLKSVHQW